MAAICMTVAAFREFAVVACLLFVWAAVGPAAFWWRGYRRAQRLYMPRANDTGQMQGRPK